MFVDTAEINIRAGRGGDGLTSFRSEKFVAKGGPDGGDGGRGGSIIVRADHNVDTLAAFRNRQQIRAENGENGKKRRAHGKSGEDMFITLPVGTTIYRDDELIADLKSRGDEAVLAAGGRGGFGNAHFKSSTRQAPRVAELGEAGEEYTLRLELKTVADVGLVGLPNAGKSTLLSVVSNARPKIADYPFTTLEPNLGVVRIYETELIFADIPGLIEGASSGKGLGDEFLRHIERTKVLLHLIDASSEDPAHDFQTIYDELQNYRVDLSQKSTIVALSKIDLIEEDEQKELVDRVAAVSNAAVHTLSAQTHAGVDEVLTILKQTIDEIRQHEHEAEDEAEIEEEVPTFTLADDPKAWEVEATENGYAVYGADIEGFARRTDMNNEEGVARLKDILDKRGISREIRRQGAKSGDSILIAGKTIIW